MPTNSTLPGISSAWAHAMGADRVRVTIELSTEAWTLLARAMREARRAGTAGPSDGDALEAVARAALSVRCRDTGDAGWAIMSSTWPNPGDGEAAAGAVERGKEATQLGSTAERGKEVTQPGSTAERGKEATQPGSSGDVVKIPGSSPTKGAPHFTNYRRLPAYEQATGLRVNGDHAHLVEWLLPAVCRDVSDFNRYFHYWCRCRNSPGGFFCQ